MHKYLKVLSEKAIVGLKIAKKTYGKLLVNYYKPNQFLLSYKIRLFFYHFVLKFRYRTRAPLYRFKLNELWARLRFLEKSSEEGSFYNSSPEEITFNLYKRVGDTTDPTKIKRVTFYLANSFQAPRARARVPATFQKLPTYILGRLNRPKIQLLSRRLRNFNLLRLQPQVISTSRTLWRKTYTFRRAVFLKEPEILFLNIKGFYKNQTIKRIVDLSSFNNFFLTNTLHISAQIRSQELYWHRQATPLKDYRDASLYYFKETSIKIAELNIITQGTFTKVLNSPN